MRKFIMIICAILATWAVVCQCRETQDTEEETEFESEETNGEEDECAVVEWSEWTPCTAACGTGVRVRTRLYRSAKAMNKCETQLMQTEKCQVMCVDVCSLPAEKGPCDAIMPRYYYDAANASCLPFAYGGCNGNANRFQTLTQCVKKCIDSERWVDYLYTICQTIRNWIG